MQLSWEENGMGREYELPPSELSRRARGLGLCENTKALHLAILENDMEKCAAALDRGADPFGIDSFGMDALMIAAAYSTPEICRAVFRPLSEEEPLWRDRKGRTAADHAFENNRAGNAEAIHALVCALEARKIGEKTNMGAGAAKKAGI